jgi:hypothetical protein
MNLEVHLPVAELELQRELVQALCNPACDPDAADRIAVIETHISFVVLTGEFAYKIKKSVDLGFLDFSTREQRRFFCEEELRLNRRLAPDLYLGVVAIRGTPARPTIGGPGEAIEYAVKMRRFPQAALLDAVVRRRELLPEQIDALARTVAAFHARAGRAGARQEFGSPAAIRAPVAQNFSQLRTLFGADEDRAALDRIEGWTEEACRRLDASFAARLQSGFVRECHGDLHLGNIVLLDGEPRVFDCIEFNPNLRWTDVISDVAFLVMDLAEHGRVDYARRFLDRYLELSGDHAGLQVLDFYLVYRAMVRAKITRMRAAQHLLPARDRDAALAACNAYLAFAQRSIAPRPRLLAITHGVSGSGKTFVSQAVLEALGAVRVRSDVERKRLHGLAPLAQSGSGLSAGLYGEEATRVTYADLLRRTRLIVTLGFPVIVDAVFLKKSQRDAFRTLAGELGVPFVILDCTAADRVLRERVASRAASGDDASEATLAVLDSQLQCGDALAADEEAAAIHVDTATGDLQPVFDCIRQRLRDSPRQAFRPADIGVPQLQ